MKYAKRFCCLLVLPLLMTAVGAAAAPARSVWQDLSESAIPTRGERLIRPDRYRTLNLDVAALQSVLAAASNDASSAAHPVLSLPMPDGSMQRFAVVAASVMADELAARYPDIRTYRVEGMDDLHAHGRIDLTPLGFHAMIMRPGGDVWIDPYQTRADGKLPVNYVSYYRHDYSRSDGETRQCLFDSTHDVNKPLSSEVAGVARLPAGSILRTYNLALATTGEYTAFHGGTVNNAMAAMVTTINRVTGIYETEVAVRLVLNANTDQLIFTNGNADPYTNNDGVVMLGQNQATIDSILGSAAYDIGHVFSTGGGGIAGFGVTCRGGLKAQGVTGLGSPIGDPFDVDFVAHEIGHQFGGSHSFNGTASACGGGNRNASTAYEPGSGSTIMAYAGICGSHNIQSNSDAYFHTVSFDQILAYTTSGSGTLCDAPTSTGNSAPVVDAGPNYIIPADTPFRLAGSAVDPEGDPMTYRWEQFDLGPGGNPQNPIGNAPLFRSFNAVPEPVRYFPKLVDILDNDISLGEVLPTTARNMRFRLTALDNRAAGGGVDHDLMIITTTTDAGPFDITNLNVFGIVWVAGTQQTISWTVGNTDQTPVNCANVAITLSLDGGDNFTDLLTASTPNDGSYTFTVPNTPANAVRVQVQCADNIFLDISDRNLRIDPSPDPDFSVDVVETSLEVCAPDVATLNVDVNEVNGFSEAVTLSVLGNPAGTGASFSVNPVTPVGSSVLSIDNTQLAAAGDYEITVNGTASTGTRSDTVTLSVTLGPPGTATLTSPADGAVGIAATPTLVWDPVADADDFTVEIASDSGFANIVYSAQESGTSHVVTAPLALGVQHFWRVRANNFCAMVNSSSFGFTTQNPPVEACSSPNLAIPDNGSANDSVVISADGPILDVIFSIDATHPYVGDVRFELQHVETGTSVTMFDRPVDQLIAGGCPLPNIAIILDDDAALPVEEQCGPGGITITGTFSPNNPLSAFDGENGAGTWMLVASDLAAGNAGTVDDWCVSMVLDEALPDADNDGVADAADNCTLVANADQRDTNSDGFGNVCDADLSNDNMIDFLDLGQMKQVFFAMGDIDADLNGDGIVDFLDLGLMKQSFFGMPGPSGLVSSP